MTIKVEDAVMTPDGAAVVTEIRRDWPVREIWVTLSDGVRRWYAEKNLDRLVLDTGLEERVRRASAFIRRWPCIQNCADGVIAHGPLPDGSWEQVQCQFCDEVATVLRLLDTHQQRAEYEAQCKEEAESLYAAIETLASVLDEYVPGRAGTRSNAIRALHQVRRIADRLEDKV